MLNCFFYLCSVSPCSFGRSFNRGSNQSGKPSFGLVCSATAFGKHFVGHYDHNDGTYENITAKENELKQAKRQIQIELYPA